MAMRSCVWVLRQNSVEPQTWQKPRRQCSDDAQSFTSSAPRSNTTPALATFAYEAAAAPCCFRHMV